VVTCGLEVTKLGGTGSAGAVPVGLDCSVKALKGDLRRLFQSNRSQRVRTPKLVTGHRTSRNRCRPANTRKQRSEANLGEANRGRKKVDGKEGTEIERVRVGDRNEEGGCSYPREKRLHTLPCCTPAQRCDCVAL